MAAKKKSPAVKKTPGKNTAKRPDDKRLKGARHTSTEECNKTLNEMIGEGYALPKRQVRYTREIGAEICSRIANGESLNRICRDDHMPAKASVHRWVLFADDKHIHVDEKLRELLTEFRDHYNNARILQAENFIDECPDIADDARNDYMEKECRNGDTITMPNPEVYQRSKLRAETRKWLAEVYLPKVQALRNRNIDLKSNQPLILQFDKQDEDA